MQHTFTVKVLSVYQQLKYNEPFTNFEEAFNYFISLIDKCDPLDIIMINSIYSVHKNTAEFWQYAKAKNAIHFEFSNCGGQLEKEDYIILCTQRVANYVSIVY